MPCGAYCGQDRVSPLFMIHFSTGTLESGHMLGIMFYLGFDLCFDVCETIRGGKYLCSDKIQTRFASDKTNFNNMFLLFDVQLY